MLSQRNFIILILGFFFFSSCDSLLYTETVYRPQPPSEQPVLYNAPQPEPIANYGSINYQTFYDALAPYGTWVEDNQFGYVWVPQVGPDFSPYQSRGHWVYSEYGWTWVSDYEWGWATFHYGRWKFSGDYGWIWIPGYTWGPAWVAWRSNGEYYGWAPLGPPSRFDEREYQTNREGHIEIGFNFSFNDAPQAEHWCFVPSNQVANSQIRNYYVDRRENNILYNQTTIINNVTNNTYIQNNQVYNNDALGPNARYNSDNNGAGRYIMGPSRTEVEGRIGSRVSTIPITSGSRPGQSTSAGNALVFYRPNLRNPSTGNPGSSFHPAPQRTSYLNQVEPVNNRGGDRGIIQNNPSSHISSVASNPAENRNYPNPNSTQDQGPNQRFNQRPNQNIHQNPNSFQNPNPNNAGNNTDQNNRPSPTYSNPNTPYNSNFRNGNNGVRPDYNNSLNPNNPVNTPNANSNLGNNPNSGNNNPPSTPNRNTMPNPGFNPRNFNRNFQPNPNFQNQNIPNNPNNQNPNYPNQNIPNNPNSNFQNQPHPNPQYVNPNNNVNPNNPGSNTPKPNTPGTNSNRFQRPRMIIKPPVNDNKPAENSPNH